MSYIDEACKIQKEIMFCFYKDAQEIKVEVESLSILEPSSESSFSYEPC